jgi:aspartate aminotransferase
MNKPDTSWVQRTQHSYPPLSATIAYLDRCRGVKHDWTSAADMFAPCKGIQCALEEVTSGNQKLSPPSVDSAPTHASDALLDAIIDYFVRGGMHTSRDRIFVSNSSFDIMQDIFTMESYHGGVLLPAPTFGHVATMARDCGRDVQILKTVREDEGKITADTLEEALKLHKPAFLILTNPVNPTGAIYSKEELEALATVLKRYDVLTISDEIFHDMVLSDTKKPCSLAAVEAMQDKVVTLNGVGKSRGLASEMSVSFCDAPPTIVQDLIAKDVAVPPLHHQEVAAQALLDTEENCNHMQTVTGACRENIASIHQHITRLNAVLRQQCGETITIAPLIAEPDATNLLVLNCKGLRGCRVDGKPLKTDVDVAEFFRDHAGVAMVPMQGFFMNGDAMMLRMSVSHAPETLQAGFDAMIQACQHHLQKPLACVKHSAVGHMR